MCAIVVIRLTIDMIASCEICVEMSLWMEMSAINAVSNECVKMSVLQSLVLSVDIAVEDMGIWDKCKSCAIFEGLENQFSISRQRSEDKSAT